MAIIPPKRDECGEEKWLIKSVCDVMNKTTKVIFEFYELKMVLLLMFVGMFKKGKGDWCPHHSPFYIINISNISFFASPKISQYSMQNVESFMYIKKPFEMQRNTKVSFL